MPNNIFPTNQHLTNKTQPTVESFRLYKHEKLCSRTAVNLLFSDGKSEFAYPLRVVYRIVPGASAPGARFLITIPKKKVRTAVGRVLMRRRIREAYRLNRSVIIPALTAKCVAIEMAIIYLDRELKPYAKIEDRLRTALARIASIVTAEPATSGPSATASPKQ